MTILQNLFSLWLILRQMELKNLPVKKILKFVKKLWPMDKHSSLLFVRGDPKSLMRWTPDVSTPQSDDLSQNSEKI